MNKDRVLEDLAKRGYCDLTPEQRVISNRECMKKLQSIKKNKPNISISQILEGVNHE